ncbi:PKD domain-containing protein, partial [Halorubrum sp. Atlit-26R]|uniref:PKD domain-containing protein n=1 Tax=Halorubrum sp. Atlit-26R TaxID=2282128 RepID=UPI000EF23228
GTAETGVTFERAIAHDPSGETVTVDTRDAFVRIDDGGSGGGGGGDDGPDDGEPSEPTVTAEIAANQTGVYPGDAISFNASESEGTDLAYNWTFGDDTNATGETVEHAYDATGTYNVTLTVTNESASDTVEVIITVVEPIQADIRAEQTSGAVGEIIEFDAYNTTSEDRTANVTYEWDFGDGATKTGEVVAHEYDTAGTYTVTLTATDTVTGETTADEVEVVIEEWTDEEVPGFGPLV